MKLCWKKDTVPAELRSMLRLLAEEYPILEGTESGLQVSFGKARETGLSEVRVRGRSATVRYSTPAQAGRALGALLAGLAGPGRTYRERTPFTMLGIMLDCSRNAVMTVEHLKLWLRRLALLGYNMVMLYTEDTYQLPGESFFGYRRGAYTRSELKAIDDYAARLNIEMVPCIQTLGHLGQILHYEAYAPVRDTSSVMLVGEPKTYALIDKMIRHWRSVYRTDRIHVGMDETHDLGRGRYLDLHGYRRPFDLLNEHLAKVVRICRKCGFKPMMWSDMYFRLGSKSHSYFDRSSVMPKDVVSRISPGVELVYWDYYHADREFYLEWIRRHRAMGKEPVMGSGIWTWNKYWYDRRITESNAGACIEACRDAGVKEIFFTEWGDNGAYCDHDSAFAGMTWCADKAYGARAPARVLLEKRFDAVCGGSYAAHLLASDLHGGIDGIQPDLWFDPFVASAFRKFAEDSPRRLETWSRGFAALARRLRKHRQDRKTGDLNHAYNVANALALRYALAADLLSAYRKKDKPGLRRVRARIPGVVRAVRAAESSFRGMWMRHNKPEGLDTIQGRFGMVESRYRELSRRLGEYLRGEVSSIPEFDVRRPSVGRSRRG